MDSFAASLALRERSLVLARLDQLACEPESSWRNKEIDDLLIFLIEVDRMVAYHRAEGMFRH